MTYVMVARWRPREDAAEKIEGILGELAKAIRKEPGNVQFTVHRSRDAPVEFNGSKATLTFADYNSLLVLSKVWKHLWTFDWSKWDVRDQRCSHKSRLVSCPVGRCSLYRQ